ncbi:hypothetical protein V502_07706 [Pseudogymnoascus sp. VKM F-4520 (FW-2644)]|nr:hypothetical protein V502_07706 [Pseudogymnoascus sp. VKM F-4520 (FW-2644)]
MLEANRNKKSICIDFKNASGIEIIQKLAEEADILVENYLPGTLKKYGLDFETLSTNNSRLIYASITGYGQTGPYSDRPGFDVMVEAEMGLMHITGERDGPPVKVGVAVTDLTTGLYAANSILAALLARGNTGMGQSLDVSLSDCQVATLSNMAESVLISGKRDTGRWDTAHPSVVPYRGFRTKDGFILIGGANDRLFGLLCHNIGKSEWHTDPRFVTNARRVENRILLEAWLEEVTLEKTTQEWMDTFEGSGLPYAAVNDLMDTLNHKHVRARNMIQEVEHPACGKMELINTPVKYSRSTPGIRTPPPTLGQHTKEILTGSLGYSEEDIEKLIAEGAVK